MTIYGITSAGFNRKPESVIVEGFETRARAKLAADLDVSSESIIGQYNGIIGSEVGILWELLEIAIRSNDPEQAEGDLLEQVAKLSGTERRSASYSLVTLSCGLNSGTVLTPEVAYAAVAGDPARLWTPIDAFTAPFAGTHAVQFVAVVPGPQSGPAGTITVIHSPVGGWNAVTNPADAVLGRIIDSDATLRLRREQQLANSGSASTRALAAALLDLDGVESVKIFENLTNITDINGLPPHSVECMVFDGITPTVLDATIAATILANKAGGVETYGSASASATDDDGQTRTISFSRPTQRPVWIDIRRTTIAGYGGDSALKEHIVSRATATYGLGKSVRVREIDSFAFEVDGVDDVTLFELGFSASPSATANLTIGPREIATFDTARVTVI